MKKKVREMNRSEEEKQRVQELLQEYSLSELVAHTIEEERENKQLKEFTNKVKKAFEYMRNTDSLEWESGEAYDVAYKMIFGENDESI